MDTFYDSNDGDSVYSHDTSKLMDVLLTMFLISWLVTGSYWVFSIWQPNFHQILHEPSNYCEETVYKFAAYQIIGCYIFLGSVLLFGCCLAFCFTCTHVFDDSWNSLYNFTFQTSIAEKHIKSVLYIEQETSSYTCSVRKVKLTSKFGALYILLGWSDDIIYMRDNYDHIVSFVLFLSFVCPGTDLKLYCGYKYTRSCMINRIWSLKQR